MKEEKNNRTGMSIVAKERPILFSTPMVQAVLGGRKTMTRRILKVRGCRWFVPEPDWSIDAINSWNKKYGCLYGNPGDIIWVRETISFFDGACIYKASNTFFTDARWKPSIFMPKDYARIWLQIENIKVERLQDISEADAKTEGIREVTDPLNRVAYLCPIRTDNFCYDLAKDAFQNLWQKINGPESWNINPWVWVITFKVLSTTGRPQTGTN